MRLDAYVNGVRVEYEHLKDYTIKNEIIDKTLAQVIDRQKEAGAHSDLPDVTC